MYYENISDIFDGFMNGLKNLVAKGNRTRYINKNTFNFQKCYDSKNYR